MLQFGKFIMSRALLAILTLVIISLVVFTLMELVPGDCAERYLAFKNINRAYPSKILKMSAGALVWINLRSTLGALDRRCLSRRIWRKLHSSGGYHTFAWNEILAVT